jgi:NADPH-dependent 2,4-dienoyl-CoA reductase/sulfur reductase-like enzyme
MTSHEFEVVVVGAGPAGLAAACTVADAGRPVALVDNSPWLGGQIWRGEEANPIQRAARHWLRQAQASHVTVFREANVFATSSPQHLLAETPAGAVELGWQRLVIATGARERFVPFPGWTLPGVIGPGGLQALVKAGWPIAGKRVVVAGSGPLLLAVADGLKHRGAHIRVIAEQAPAARVYQFGVALWPHPAKLAQGLRLKARLLGVPYRCGCWPVRAAGDETVRQVTLTDGRRTSTETCDYLACGFGLAPNLELPRLLGCRIADGFVQVNEFQETSVKNVFCAGEPTGIAGADAALVAGRIAGFAAIGNTGQARGAFAARARWQRFGRTLRDAFALRPELRRLAEADTVVCRCEDVRRGELERHDNWRAAKLHTRCGMGNCQGRTCGDAANVLFGWTNDSVRPPLLPVKIASLLSPVADLNPNPTPSAGNQS